MLKRKDIAIYDVNDLLDWYKKEIDGYISEWDWRYLKKECRDVFITSNICLFNYKEKYFIVKNLYEINTALKIIFLDIPEIDVLNVYDSFPIFTLGENDNLVAH